MELHFFEKLLTSALNKFFLARPSMHFYTEFSHHGSFLPPKLVVDRDVVVVVVVVVFVVVVAQTNANRQTQLDALIQNRM